MEHEPREPSTDIDAESGAVFRLGISPVESNKKIGPLRSHLYNYSFAKHQASEDNRSKVIFRVDDSDKEKHTREMSFELYRFFTEDLGLEFDLNPTNSIELTGMSLYQSERQDRYREMIEALYDDGIAFVDPDSGLALFDIQKYVDMYSDVIQYDDLHKGVVSVCLADHLNGQNRYFPLLRSDGSALYHLATVVDDADFGVTHVVRGNDKISVAQYQEMVRVALGLEPKRYLHTPLLTDERGRRLGGQVAFDDFVRDGIMPHSLISYMVSSGYGDPDEIYPSIDDFISNFDYGQVHKHDARFDIDRLRSVNERLTRRVSDETYIKSLQIYLCRTGQDELNEQLRDDEELSTLVQKIRRNPTECPGIIMRILNPHYDEPQDVTRISEIIDAIIINDYKLPKPEDLGLDNRTFYDSLRWILVGTTVFPDIIGVYHYLDNKGLLASRVTSAKEHLQMSLS